MGGASCKFWQHFLSLIFFFFLPSLNADLIFQPSHAKRDSTDSGTGKRETSTGLFRIQKPADWRMWRTPPPAQAPVTCTCMESDGSWWCRLTERDVQKSALPRPGCRPRRRFTEKINSLSFHFLKKESSCAALSQKGEKLILRLVQS